MRPGATAATAATTVLAMAWALGLASPAAADDLLDCAKRSYAETTGVWEVSFHTRNLRSGRFDASTTTFRTQATKTGLVDYVVEDGQDKVYAVLTWTENGYTSRQIDEYGDEIGMITSTITACAGPDAQGMTTVEERRVWTDPSGRSSVMRTRFVGDDQSYRMMSQSPADEPHVVVTDADGDGWVWTLSALGVRPGGIA